MQQTSTLNAVRAASATRRTSPCLCAPPRASKRSLESVPLHGNKQRGRLRVQLSPEATQLERSDAIQKVKASLLAKLSSSMTTTANQRAAQRASILINLLGGGGSIFTTELVLFDVGQF